MSDDDSEYFFNTLPGKVIRSKRFSDPNSGQSMRILSQIIETPEEIIFTSDLSEIVVRRTPTGRQQIKATVFENDRRIKTLTIQRYHRSGGGWIPAQREHFSFVGDEIIKLKKFLASVERSVHDKPKYFKQIKIMEGGALSHRTQNSIDCSLLNTGASTP